MVRILPVVQKHWGSLCGWLRAGPGSQGLSHCSKRNRAARCTTAAPAPGAPPWGRLRRGWALGLQVDLAGQGPCPGGAGLWDLDPDPAAASLEWGLMGQGANVRVWAWGPWKSPGVMLRDSEC